MVVAEAVSFFFKISIWREVWPPPTFERCHPAVLFPPLLPYMRSFADREWKTNEVGIS